MNPTKQKILMGEKLLAENQKYEEQVMGASSFEALKLALGFLFQERILNLQSRLAKLKEQWAVEFEKESAEANSRFPAVLANAKKYIGKEPKAVSVKIKAIVDSYENEGQTHDQESKNDDFYELIEHVRFFNTKVK